MTERLSKRGGAAPARVRAIALTGAGWADIRGSFARLWPAWLAWTAFNAVAQFAGHQILKPGAGGLTLSPEIVAHGAASSVGMAVFSAVCLRAWLAPDKPLWRLDGGFFAYVGVVSLASLLTLVAAGLQPAPPADPATVDGAAVGVGLAFVLLFFGGAWVAIRLILWPIGLLLGDRAMTPAESWRRMRGVVWPYIVACVILGVLPLLVSLVFASQYFYHAQIAALILGQPFAVFYRMTGVAVGAAAYRTRVGAEGVGAPP